MRILREASVLLICLLAVPGWLSAQQWSNERSYAIAITQDTLLLDTLSILPETFRLHLLPDGTEVDTSAYTLDWSGSRLIWLQKPEADSALVTYRVMGWNFSRTYFSKADSLLNLTPDIIINPFLVDDDPTGSDLFDFGGLNYNGSFTRGISFGNNQDVVLNSAFNLQLNGTLGNDVELVAAMTDNNIPIQPDGNTQQIQDFDKVFISLTRKQSTLTVGDFDWRMPHGYFLRYNKKLQGAAVQTAAVLDEDRNIATRFKGSVAIARGQWARNSFFGQEGNQGPYRLQGNSGEGFIIVLAGSERIFIDGVPMVRGAEHDYVIDYNTGEVTFTPNRLITKDIRIIIEFEYSVLNYFRSLVQLDNQWDVGRWQFYAGIYSEQDAKNQPVLQDLDSTRRAVLRSVGDSVHLAIVPGFDSVGFSIDVVRYKRIDSTVGGTLYSPVFVYSTNEDSATWQVSFSFVGEGQGNYRISTSGNVNGRVYEWLAPVGGLRQGSYEPVQPVVAPQQRQLFNVGAGYNVSDRTRLRWEVALSNRDANTLSALHDADDRGLATAIQGEHILALVRDSLKPVNLTLSGIYEWTGSRFRPVETYRPMEFTRDWNVTQYPVGIADQHLASGGARLQGARWGWMNYELGTFQMPELYSGLRHGFHADIRTNGWHFRSQSTLLTTDAIDGESQYLRPTLDLSKRMDALGGLRVGVGYMQEDNRITGTTPDSLLGTSFGFREWRFRMESPDTSKVPITMHYVARIDRIPVEGRLPINNRGNTFNLQGAILTSEKQQLRWTATYRNLRYEDPAAPSTGEQTALGRLQYTFAAVGGVVRSSTLYEIGTGQEPRREFTYLKVPEGQGNFVWNDNNEDGIPQLDEFEIASANDAIFANYIRVYTPTQEFIRTNIAQFNQVLEISPAAKIKSADHPLAFLRKWSNLTTAKLNRKVANDGSTLQMNPFDLDVADTSLVAVSALLRNSLFYNRFGSDLSAELTLQDNRNKQLLTNGPESRDQRFAEMQLRWVFSSRVSATVKGRQGAQANTSEGLPSRNFRFTFSHVEPELTVQSPGKWRVAAQYLWQDKLNQEELGGERASVHQFTASMRYNEVIKSNLTARFSFAMVDFNGRDNSALGYAMLAGLRSGNNWLWNIAFERRLSDNITMSLTYDGRKTGTAKMIHIGQAQVRAIF